MSSLKTTIMRRITGSQGEPNLDDLLDKSDTLMAASALQELSASETASPRHSFAGGNPTKLMSKRQLLAYLPRGFKEIRSFFVSTKLIRHPAPPTLPGKASAVDGIVRDFFARQGIPTWGTAVLPADLVFAGKTAPAPYVVVFAAPMDAAAIAKAPDFAVLLEVADAYGRVGRVANELTRTLRQQGIWAMPGHPLGGVASYARVAELAGLGRIGRSGMLISPECGPCQRIGLVFCDVPVASPRASSHEWVSEFCETCGACARHCPAEAIPRGRLGDGQHPGADGDRCLPYFHEHWGCSLCIAVCPFMTAGYEKIAAARKRRPA